MNGNEVSVTLKVTEKVTVAVRETMEVNGSVIL